jgi:hypothetical protein
MTGTTSPAGPPTQCPCERSSYDNVVAVDLGIHRRNSCSATQQARTKNDMKPSRTPWCFFQTPRPVRSAITADMSTSLKVVSIAAVFCASSDAAIVRRDASCAHAVRAVRRSVVRAPPGLAQLQARGD